MISEKKEETMLMWEVCLIAHIVRAMKRKTDNWGYLAPKSKEQGSGPSHQRASRYYDKPGSVRQSE